MRPTKLCPGRPWNIPSLGLGECGAPAVERPKDVLCRQCCEASARPDHPSVKAGSPSITMRWPRWAEKGPAPVHPKGNDRDLSRKRPALRVQVDLADRSPCPCSVNSQPQGRQADPASKQNSAPRLGSSHEPQMVTRRSDWDVCLVSAIECRTRPRRREGSG